MLKIMTANISNKLRNSPFRIVILGGGVSGIAAAQSLLSSCKRDKLSVTLLEGSSRFGGWVNSKTYPDGCVFELGPRTLRPAGIPGKQTLQLISKLGLENEVIPVDYKHPSATKRYIYAKGKINLMPNKLLSLISPQSPLTKSIASTLLKEPFQPKSQQHDESIHEFFKRRLGTEIADYFVDAFCYGIYASGSKELSMATCFPSLVKYEKEHGSLLMGALRSRKERDLTESCPLYERSQREKWRIWTLCNGLQDLVDKWIAHVDKLGLETKLNTPCESLEFTEGKRVLCHTKNGPIEADHVISSLFSSESAKLLPANHSELKQLLDKIPSVSVAVVNLEFAGKVLPVDGFGFLVPSCESMEILGVVFDSCVFDDGRGNTKLTVMMGGSNFSRLFGSPESANEDQLLGTALKNIQKILGIKANPLKHLVTVQRNCIPQYQVGHLDLIESITEEMKDLPLTLVGSSYKAVGLNDCIYNSQIEVDALLNRLFSS